MENFGRRMRVLRTEADLTQEELATLVGVSPLTIKRYESGDSQPSMDVLPPLANALRVTLDWLVHESDEETVHDREVRQRFWEVARFDKESRKVALAVLDALILQHRTKLKQQAAAERGKR
ncbi:MAG: helix-turn-helix transcriptional regulator [Myxococcota bacterium]